LHEFHLALDLYAAAEEALLDKILGYCVHYPQVLSMAAADTALAKARQVFSEQRRYAPDL